MFGKLRQFISHESGRPQVRFVVVFLAISVFLFSVYSFPYSEGSWARHWSDAYLRAYAHLAGWVLSIFERGIVLSGQNIVGRYSLRIIRGCDAVDAQILLVAAVLASPLHSWRWRIGGAIAGALLVLVANVARICSLYYIGLFLPSYFDLFHHEVWPLVLIAFAGGVFVLWSRMAQGHGEVGRAAA